MLLSLNSEWKIVRTAKRAAEARPVQTMCERPSSEQPETVGSEEPGRTGNQPAGRRFPSNSEQRPECKSSSRWGMALWQMKTLIRDGRVSVLFFFFNPYPGAFAGPPCLCLCAKKFPAPLCNKILFWERSNKLTMWAHCSLGDPATGLTQKQRAWAGPEGLGHLDWPVGGSCWPIWDLMRLPAPLTSHPSTPRDT